MKVTLHHSNELSTEWSVARQQVQSDLDRIAQQVNAGWTKEHNPDGTHAAVTVSGTLSLQDAPLGVPTDLPHEANRYRMNGSGTWTVSSADQIYLRVVRFGQMAWVEFWLQETVTAADTAADLIIRLPELHPLRAIVTSGVAFGSQHTGGQFRWTDSIVGTSGFGEVVAVTVNESGFQAAQLRLIKSDAATFAITTNLMVRGACMFPLNKNNIAIPF